MKAQLEFEVLEKFFVDGIDITILIGFGNISALQIHHTFCRDFVYLKIILDNDSTNSKF